MRSAAGYGGWLAASMMAALESDRGRIVSMPQTDHTRVHWWPNHFGVHLSAIAAFTLDQTNQTHARPKLFQCENTQTVVFR